MHDSIALNWLVVHAVVHDGQNSVGVKEIVSQNVISESGPLDRLFEEKMRVEPSGTFQFTRQSD